MKKQIGPVLIFILLCKGAGATGAVSFDDPDWSGTWAGEMNLPGSQETVNLTLVINRNSRGYSIKVSDTMGMVLELDPEFLKIDREGMLFSYQIPDGSGGLEWIDLKLKRRNQILSGTCRDEDNRTGAVRFRHQKRG